MSGNKKLRGFFSKRLLSVRDDDAFSKHHSTTGSRQRANHCCAKTLRRSNESPDFDGDWMSVDYPENFNNQHIEDIGKMAVKRFNENGRKNISNEIINQPIPETH